jgi:hypothetical protein
LYSTDICYICNKLILTTGLIIKYYEKDDKKVHVKCIPKGVKCVKVTVDMRMPKCGLCGFFIDDKRCMHKICENLLKTMKE